MLATLKDILQEMLSYQLYKKTQGKIVRQCTAATIAVILFGGLWQLSNLLMSHTPLIHYGVPFVLALVFLWFSYRIVNYPIFADFLIQVEAEMRKVSWPSTSELVNSSVVVIVVMFFLAGLLFGYDLLIKNLLVLCGDWGRSLFQTLGIF
ncbi:MAG: preprotein translocase subunit SecE [Planctomycetia bacterium]|nr:preprotein translocase subunit SecE [Planctomycetia bacterium]